MCGLSAGPIAQNIWLCALTAAGVVVAGSYDASWLVGCPQ